MVFESSSHHLYCKEPIDRIKNNDNQKSRDLVDCVMRMIQMHMKEQGN